MGEKYFWTSLSELITIELLFFELTQIISLFGLVLNANYFGESS